MAAAEPDLAGVTSEGPRWNRLWLLILLPVGFGFGLIGGFLQEHRITIGPVAIPWASVLVLATMVVCIRALSLNIETRLAGGLFFGGWLTATALLAVPNPSGDIVFTADIGSVGYLLAGCVLGAAVAAWPLFLDLPGKVELGRADSGIPQ